MCAQPGENQWFHIISRLEVDKLCIRKWFGNLHHTELSLIACDKFQGLLTKLSWNEGFCAQNDATTGLMFNFAPNAF